MRVTPLGFCLRVIVNEKPLNLENTTPSVLSVLLLIYFLDIWLITIITKKSLSQSRVNFYRIIIWRQKSQCVIQNIQIFDNLRKDHRWDLPPRINPHASPPLGNILPVEPRCIIVVSITDRPDKWQFKVVSQNSFIPTNGSHTMRKCKFLSTTEYLPPPS